MVFFKRVFKGISNINFDEWIEGKTHFFQPIIKSFILCDTPFKFEWILQNYQVLCPDTLSKKEVERELVTHLSRP